MECGERLVSDGALKSRVFQSIVGLFSFYGPMSRLLNTVSKKQSVCVMSKSEDVAG